MLDVLDDMIRRHRESGILVDTNLFVVALLAAWDVEEALRVKRVQGYTEDDVLLLQLVLSHFSRCIVTPAVLAEVSNIAAQQLTEPRKSDFFEFLQAVFTTPIYEQRCVSLSSASTAACFVRFGFTDATIEQLGRAGTPVLTEDAKLYAHLRDHGVEAFNLTHIRFLGR